MIAQELPQVGLGGGLLGTTLAWCAVGVAISTVISGVIFGLRQRARRAERQAAGAPPRRPLLDERLQETTPVAEAPVERGSSHPGPPRHLGEGGLLAVLRQRHLHADVLQELGQNGPISHDIVGGQRPHLDGGIDGEHGDLAAVARRNNLPDLDSVLLGELPVAFVMAGNRHDGARAITHQHEVGDPQRYFVASQRVNRGDAERHALFLHRFERCFGRVAPGALLDERRRPRFLRCGGEENPRPGR